MMKALVPALVFCAVLMGCQATGPGMNNSATAMTSSQTPAAIPAGMTAHGYPHVLATVYLDPAQESKITVPDEYASGHVNGYMTIDIPANAFSTPVRLDILAGSNRDWDKLVKPDQTVVANFAYRVVDVKTGKLVEKFDHPLTYSVSDSMITKDSVYWATTAGSPIQLVNANKASRISGTTLDHPTPVSSVGWIITTPKTEVAGKM